MRPYTKITSLFLAFFLMFSNIGLALDVHFCGDNIVASELVFLQKTENFSTHKDINQENHSVEKSCCGIPDDHYDRCKDEYLTQEKSCCGISDDHYDCCKDEYLTQENLDVVIVKSISVSIDHFLVAQNTYIFDFFTSINDENVFFSSNDRQLGKTPLYKRYCQLIFYA